MSAAATLAGAVPDLVPGGHAIPWRQVGHHVRRLQARIVKAVGAGRWGKVRAPVYLLTHSFRGRAVAILRVTTNPGAPTPGVDGEHWDTPGRKAAACYRLRRHGYQPQPLRRVYIPKSSAPSQLRPLGIPTLTDRAMQALYLLGLDPMGETTADANSYGFRCQRSCADALDQGYKVLGQRHNATRILEGAIKACFDRASHNWLLNHIPMDRFILQKWLQAGYLEKDVFVATTEGTPQGGLLPPPWRTRPWMGWKRCCGNASAPPAASARNKVHLVRSADDFIITGTAKELRRNEARPLVAHFLSERGLELSHEKTGITQIDDGFDFLGQNVRRFGTKLLRKPSRRNEQRFLAKVDDTVRQPGGHLTAGELIERLKLLIRGWVQYHRHVSNNRRLARLDRLILGKLWRWARRRHRHHSAAWVKAQYFAHPGGRGERFHGTIPDRAGGHHTVWLVQAGATRIRRHVKIRSEANPYDPAWEVYCEERLALSMASTLTGRGTARYLWWEQDGRWRVCSQPLTREAGWHVHHLLWRSHGGGDIENRVFLHPNCHRQVHSEGLVVNKTASREGRSGRLEP